MQTMLIQKIKLYRCIKYNSSNQQIKDRAIKIFYGLHVTIASKLKQNTPQM